MKSRAAAGEKPGWRHPTICYVVGLFLLVYLVLACFVLVIVHLDLWVGLEKAMLLRAHILCAGFGVLGATMAAMRKYYRALITESTERRLGRPVTETDWSFGWVYYYFTRPPLGAVLGALAFTLSFIGFQVLSPPGNIEISSEGRHVLYAFAFISGFAVSHVLDRLEAFAKRIVRDSSDSAGMRL